MVRQNVVTHKVDPDTFNQDTWLCVRGQVKSHKTQLQLLISAYHRGKSTTLITVNFATLYYIACYIIPTIYGIMPPHTPTVPPKFFRMIARYEQ